VLGVGPSVTVNVNVTAPAVEHVKLGLGDVALLNDPLPDGAVQW
jgi:hypothetical protein